jgi:hypothetical protein
VTSTALAPPARSRAWLRGGVLLVLASATVLQRFGVNAGALSTSAALPAIYLLLVMAAAGGVLVLSLERTLLLGVCLSVALMSLLLNEASSPPPSPSSLLLLAAMYLPFAFMLKPQALAEDDAGWVLQRFLDVAAVCAVAGIVQFLAQAVVHADWLFDFTPYIPERLRAVGTFNTVISLGSFNKSNGFFLREPSGFSYLAALGLIAEWTTRRRSGRLACFGLALLLTYSGSGILALLLAALHPFGVKTLLRVSLLALVGGAVFWLLGDALNLSLTLSRVSEFDSQHSSAYMRYVAPMRLVLESLDTPAWAAWLGHGPGTIFRTARDYEFHDPTWAKLAFEYGGTGIVAFIALYLAMLRRPGVSLQLRAALFWGWLILGGHLLSPEHNFLSLVLIGLLPMGGAHRAVSRQDANEGARLIAAGGAAAS